MFRFLLAVLLLGGMGSLASIAQDKADPKKKKATPVLTDPASGEELGKLTPTLVGAGHQYPIVNLFFTSDSKRLITVGSNRMVCVWDVATGTQLKVWHLPGKSRISEAALSSDDKTLAVVFRFPVMFTPTQSAYIVLLHLGTGQVRGIPHHQNFWLNNGLTFSNNGTRLLAYGDDQGVDWFSSMKAVWSTPFDDVIQTQPSRNTADNIIDTNIFRAAFSPSDDKVAYIGRAEDKPHFITPIQNVAFIPGLVPKGTEIKSTLLDSKIPHPHSVAWSKDGKQILVGYENGLKIWNDTGKLVSTFEKVKLGVFPRTINAPKVQVHHAQFLNENEILVCWRTGNDNTVRAEVGLSVVQVGKGMTRDLYHRYSWNLPMPSAAVSPNGQWAAFTHGAEGLSFTVVDVAKKQKQFAADSANESPSQIAWSKDGSSILWNSTRTAEDANGVPFQGVNLKKMEYFRNSTLAKLNVSGDHEKAAKTLREKYLWREYDNGTYRVVMHSSKGTIDDLSLDLVKDGKTTHFANDAEIPVRAFTVSADPVNHPWIVVGRNWLKGYDATGKNPLSYSYPHQTVGAMSITSSPDGRYFAATNMLGLAQIYNPNYRYPLLTIYSAGEDWIIFADNGYYASSPNGDKIFGWTTPGSKDYSSRFIPAAQLSDKLHRPDVIQAFLKHRSMTAALKETKANEVDFKSNLPPTATLQVTPKNGGLHEVVIEGASAVGSQEKITEVHLLLDGRPIRLADGTNSIKKYNTPVAELNPPVRFNVTLDPGTNGKLVARVHTKETYTFSNDIDVKVAAPPIVRNKKGTLYYFGVGIAEYAADKGKTHPLYKLEWCKKDVNDLQAGIEKHIFPNSRFAEFKAMILTNESATRDGILKEVEAMKTKLKPADLLIIHFSCHGEKDAEEGGLYLIPYDWNPEDLKKTAVPGDELQKAFMEYTAPVLLLLDACHSGAMKSPSDELLRRFSDERTGVTVMTAALSYQKAQERKGLKNGVFTAGLLEGMQNPDAIDPFSKKQYAVNLYSYALGYVNRETNGEQLPGFNQSGAVPPIVLKEAAK